MLLPKFTALQSRFAASLAASLVLVLAFSNPHLAYAANADSIAHEDHNHPRLLELLYQSEPLDASSSENKLEVEDYTPEFAGIDRSIIGRADATIQALGNNAPGKSNISGGQNQYWTFPNKTIWGPFSPQTPGLPSNISKRDTQVVRLTENSSDEEMVGGLVTRQTSPATARRIFISINTCDQPHASDPNPNGAPPQLELYLSKKSTNQKPDKNTNDGIVSIDGGCGEYVLDATSDIWFAVSAPQSSNFGGNYNYELTASIDALYASCDGTSTFNSTVVDSDTTSALLYLSILSNPNTSDPVHQAWMNGPPRFNVYVHNQDDPTVLGLHRSVCGLKNHAQIQGNLQGKNTSNVDTDMTARGNGFPKQEFHVKNLNGSSTYYAIIGIDGNSTSSGGGVVGGGGTVWEPINFTTKSGMRSPLRSYPIPIQPNQHSRLTDNNCQIIYNLPFCSQVAYAVPSNPNVTNLTAIYDSFAETAYKNFSFSLQQIPCNTTSTAQYSLARTCDHCDHAYKQWLCAVAIPRCEDFSSRKSYLQPRAVASPFINGSTGNGPEFSDENQNRWHSSRSRNWIIDAKINAGPYKEILPCIDLCHNLVQSCPAALGFACPLENYGRNYSYGLLSEPFCNSLGMLQNTAGLAAVKVRDMLIAMTVALIVSILL